MGPPKQTCLVTGGAGFLGRHLVEQLLATGAYEVVVFDLQPYRGGPGAPQGVRSIVGDLRDPVAVSAALEGVDVVFHTATAAPAAANTANQRLMQAVNVRGTQHVLAACRQHKVRRLVYTSSASVVFEGHDLTGVDEAQPYAARPIDFYTSTKIEAERLVLAASDAELACCALRPSGIFGEGDQLFVPTIVKKAREGKMKYIIGSGRNRMDFTYVGNVAQAHLLAAERLEAGGRLAGQAYFITNADPQPFWGFMGDVLEPLGYARPSRRLPWQLVYALALVLQLVTWLLKPFVALPPSEFTPVRIRIAKSDRQLCTAKAERDLGYRPRVAVGPALARTLAAYEHLRARPGARGARQAP